MHLLRKNDHCLQVFVSTTTITIPRRTKFQNVLGLSERCVGTFVSIGNNRTGLYRHKTSSSRNIWVNGIAFLSSFSDTNHCRRSPHARIANNLPAHIGVGIALVRNIGVMPVVSLLTQIIHSIALIGGTEISLKSRIFLHIGYHLTCVIIPMPVHWFRSITRLRCLTLTYPMMVMNMRMAIRHRSRLHRRHILDPDLIWSLFHLLEFSAGLSDGVTVPNPQPNTFNFSFVRNSFRQVLKIQRLHLPSRFWITSDLMH